MSVFIQQLTPLQRFSAFIILVVLGCSVALLGSSSELIGRAVGAALALGALCLAVIVSLRKEESANRVRRYSLYFGLAVSLAAIAPTPIQLWLTTAFQQAIQHYGIEPPPEPLMLSPSNAVLVFAWGVIVVVNLATIDWTAMGRHPRRRTTLFQDRTLKERLKLLCRDLKVDLDDMDARTDWRHTHYVPLDAEVDVMRGTRRKRRVQKLLNALKGHPNSRLFLVLGDPGAGKSVALRKLCRDLLDEVEKTGRIPLYVNLREWRASTPWSPDSPPTFDDLKFFIHAHLSKSLPGRSRDFFRSHFDDLVDHGHLFFLLDSFDEIPEVLDNTNADWLIRDLSKVITQLLVGGHDSRGAVASRFYRSPQLPGEDHVVLEVRPFSDYQIGKAIDLSSMNGERLKALLFVERPEWISFSRNPFTLGLMVQYADQHQTLPATRAELFEHTIDRALTLVSETIDEIGLTRAEIVRASETIAAEMLAPKSVTPHHDLLGPQPEPKSRGLDIPIARLRDSLDQMPIEHIVDVLEAARIVRVTRPQRTVSFVHRRFNEFFLIADFRRDPENLPLEEIPTDGRLRDALVLYTEVAEPAHAGRIAGFCWRHACYLASDEVRMGMKYISGLHALRFLNDSFRRRRDILIPFHRELTEMIEKLTSSSEDLLLVKHSVEAAGLLPEERLEECLTGGLDRRVGWLSETAFRSMKYLSRVNEHTKAKLLEYLFDLPIHYQLWNYREHIYNLSLSPAFVEVRRRFTLGLMAFLVAMMALMAFMATMPVLGLSILNLVILLWLIVKLVPSAERWKRARLRLVGPLVPGVDADPLRVLIAAGLICGILAATALIWTGIGIGAAWVADSLSEVSLVHSFLDQWPALGEWLAKRHVDYGGGTIQIANMDFTVTAVIAGITAIPATYLLVPGALGSMLSSTLTAVKFVCFYAVVMPLVILGFEFLERFIPTWVGFGLAVIWGVLLAFGALWAVISGCVSVWKRMVQQLADRSRMATLKTKFDASRAGIAEALTSLGTRRARLTFLRWVDDQQRVKQVADKLRSPDNVWPGGRRPNWGNDEASEYLAMLDERWLGLQQRS